MGKEKLKNVYYLEDFDVDQDGNITGFSKMKLSSKPMVILVYGDWCGYCRDFKPIYQQFANMMKDKGEPIYVCAIDSDEEVIGKRMPEILKPRGFRGFPHIAVYDNNGEYIEYKDARTLEGLYNTFEKMGVLGEIKASQSQPMMRQFDNQTVRQPIKIKGQCR